MEESITIDIDLGDPELQIADKLLNLNLHPAKFDLSKLELGEFPLNPYDFGDRYQDLDEQDRIHRMLVNAPVRLGCVVRDQTKRQQLPTSEDTP